MVAIMAIKVHGKDSHAGRSIYNGLTFSAVGTAYYSNEEKHSLSLIGGLTFFLVGHLYYISGFNHSSTRKFASSWSSWIIPISTYFGVFSIIIQFILPSTPFEWIVPVFLYGTVVATVFWKAIDASLATGHAESVLGALVLAISDFILGYSQFVGPIKNGQLLFMVTFYLSQILISKFALNNKLLY
ncbi:YhhN-like protein [Globomyces pollinis-pini]|nr:YhhN-like protein [Globomyces pollinis-pini]